MKRDLPDKDPIQDPIQEPTSHPPVTHHHIPYEYTRLGRPPKKPKPEPDPPTTPPTLWIPPTDSFEWEALKEALASGTSAADLQKRAALRIIPSSSTSYKYYASPDRTTQEYSRFPLDGSDFVVFSPKGPSALPTENRLLFPGLHVQIKQGKGIPTVSLGTIISLAGPHAHAGSPSAVICLDGGDHSFLCKAHFHDLYLPNDKVELGPISLGVLFQLRAKIRSNKTLFETPKKANRNLEKVQEAERKSERLEEDKEKLTTELEHAKEELERVKNAKAEETLKLKLEQLKRERKSDNERIALEARIKKLKRGLKKKEKKRKSEKTHSRSKKHKPVKNPEGSDDEDDSGSSNSGSDPSDSGSEYEDDGDLPDSGSEYECDSDSSQPDICDLPDSVSDNEADSDSSQSEIHDSSDSGSDNEDDSGSSDSGSDEEDDSYKNRTSRPKTRARPNSAPSKPTYSLPVNNAAIPVILDALAYVLHTPPNSGQQVYYQPQPQQVFVPVIRYCGMCGQPLNYNTGRCPYGH